MDIRLLAEHTYLQLHREGKPLSLVQFARQSQELLGQPIPYETIKTWATQYAWNDRLDGGFDTSQEMRDTKKLFDLAREDALGIDDETKGSMAAGYARTFLRATKKIPRYLVAHVEDDIVRVREALHTYTLANWASIPPTYRTALVGVWSELEKVLIRDVIVEEQRHGVNPDAVILASRENQ